MVSEKDWKWYVGHSDEEYASGPYNTRAEAVQIAKEEFEGGYIVEAYKNPINLADYFEVDSFLENFEEQNYELANIDGDPIINVSHAQTHDLQRMMREAITQWQKKHNLVFMPWIFSATRNGEYINGEMADS